MFIEAMGLFSVIFYIVLVFSVVIVLRHWNQKPKSKNPFVLKTYPARPIVLDRAERKKVLKNSFKIQLVPKNLDVIVIGSGMGGLACASLLSRSGKRVLVLEQHDRIGGGTHTFKKNGFEFDIGIHYVGEMQPGSVVRSFIDLLTDDQLQWAELKRDFDTVVIDQPGKSLRKYVYTKGHKAFQNKLLNYFPSEQRAIDQFFHLLRSCRSATNALMLLKLLPKFVLKICLSLRLFNVIFRDYDYVSKNSLADVLNKLTNNKDLKTVLMYSFGDYGALPSQTPFLMHGMLTNHFLRSGGYYPVGGGSEIAYQIVPSIERIGGAVLAGATVTEILLSNGRACGVRVKKTFNSEEHDIYAPVVVSSVGIFNTYKSLLPKEICNKYNVMQNLNFIEPGVSCIQVMVSLNGTKEELGLEAENFWIFTSDDPDGETRKFLSMSREDVVEMEIPLLFLSFPSTKDPTWNHRFPNKTTCAIVTLARLEWFEEWKNKKVKKRGQVYDSLKSIFVTQAWRQVLKLFPHLEDKVISIDGGTPVTHAFYLNSMHGEIYGMHHSKERFFSQNAMHLRPETSVPGLYLSGQDIFSAGFSGSSFSGLLAASKILNRYLLTDLIKYTQQVRKNK